MINKPAANFNLNGIIESNLQTPWNNFRQDEGAWRKCCEKSARKTTGKLNQLLISQGERTGGEKCWWAKTQRGSAISEEIRGVAKDSVNIIKGVKLKIMRDKKMLRKIIAVFYGQLSYISLLEK